VRDGERGEGTVQRLAEQVEVAEKRPRRRARRRTTAAVAPPTPGQDGSGDEQGDCDGKKKQDRGAARHVHGADPTGGRMKEWSALKEGRIPLSKNSSLSYLYQHQVMPSLFLIRQLRELSADEELTTPAELPFLVGRVGDKPTTT
jgi:hypothetical protein